MNVSVSDFYINAMPTVSNINVDVVFSLEPLSAFILVAGLGCCLLAGWYLQGKRF